MKYRFEELLKYWAERKGGKAIADLDSKELDLANKGINFVRETIWYHKQWGFAGDKMYLSLREPYREGTIEGTVNTPYVTVSDATLVEQIEGVPFRGAFLTVGTRLYEIKKVDVSGNRFILANNLIGTIPAGTAYTVYFIEYNIRWDVGALRKVIIDEQTPLDIRPEKMNASEIEEGESEVCFAAGQSEVEFDSGVGTLTNGSDEVTTVSGFDLTDSQLIGKSVTSKANTDFYYIIDVDDSASKIFLDRPFSGATETGAVLIVDPRGTPKLGFQPYPEAARTIKILYTKQLPILRDNDDLTGLPNDVPMLAGIDVLTTKWETVGEKGFVNAVLFADRQFVRSMRVLNFRQTNSNLRMFTKDEMNGRSRRDTNPWNRYRGF